MEAAQARQKRVDASPKREDFEREFGKHRVKDEANGEWSLTLHEREDIRKAHQMQEGSRRLDIERGLELKAKSDGRRERLVRHDGRVVEIQDELVDQVKKKLRPTGRNGRSVAIRSHLSSSYGKYEQGPDGMWFVWNGGWEPTNLFVKGSLPVTQRDPDGNVWAKDHEGEWTIAPPEAA